MAEDRLRVVADRDGLREDGHHLEDFVEDAEMLLGCAVVRAPACVGGLVVFYLADALVDEISAELGEGSPFSTVSIHSARRYNVQGAYMAPSTLHSRLGPLQILQAKSHGTSAPGSTSRPRRWCGRAVSAQG